MYPQNELKLVGTLVGKPTFIEKDNGCAFWYFTVENTTPPGKHHPANVNHIKCRTCNRRADLSKVKVGDTLIIDGRIESKLVNGQEQMEVFCLKVVIEPK